MLSLFKKTVLYVFKMLLSMFSTSSQLSMHETSRSFLNIYVYYTTFFKKGAIQLQKFLFRSLVELTGNPIASSLLKKITSSSASRFLIKPFAKANALNTEEMARQLHEYKSLQDLFTRELKPGIRPVDPSPQSVVSPVDGVLTSFGKISEQDSFLVKGQDYKLDSILGNQEKAKQFSKGWYFIFYLSPSHYHRIHSPVNGEIEEKWSCGGKSYPVNEIGMKHAPKPLSTNYRLITLLKNDNCQMAVIKVGALNVNSIHFTHKDPSIYKGNEMAYFSFGSTVVLLIDSAFEPCESLKLNMSVQYGKRIGMITASH